MLPPPTWPGYEARILQRKAKEELGYFFFFFFFGLQGLSNGSEIKQGSLSSGKKLCGKMGWAENKPGTLIPGYLYKYGTTV